MKLRPINGRILVKPSEAKGKISSGLYLPDTVEEKLREGDVIAKAEDATDEVVVGDHVIYQEFGGTEVKIETEDYILLTGDDLLAKYTTVDKIPE
ncbi:MAG: co-chaperone GroES [Syntrophaceae bacterium]|nr:co-chaperone GroES [Syntrophaceae bacterium]